MTPAQERVIQLALNVLQVGFFECPKHYYEYFVGNDDWALMMTAAGENAVGTPPAQLAVAVLRQAVAREGFFAEMTDFEPPAHYCSFLVDQVRRGERRVELKQCQPRQTGCPYASFEHMRETK